MAKRLWDLNELIKLIEEHGGGLTPQKLKEILIGSAHISVDDDESGKKIQVSLDETEFAELMKSHIRDTDSIRAGIDSNHKLYFEALTGQAVKVLKHGETIDYEGAPLTLNIPTTSLTDGTTAPNLEAVQRGYTTLNDIIADTLSSFPTMIIIIDEEEHYSSVLGAYVPYTTLATNEHILKYEIGIETPTIMI